MVLCSYLLRYVCLCLVLFNNTSYPYTKNKADTDLSRTDLLQDNHRSVFETITCMLLVFCMPVIGCHKYDTYTCHQLVLTAAKHSMGSLFLVIIDLIIIAIIFIFYKYHNTKLKNVVSYLTIYLKRQLCDIKLYFRM